MAKITVVGAGLSGLVAATNLAREGFEVLVVEAGKGIGGAHTYHPSVHGTPILPHRVSSYINIDISPYFNPAGDCRLHVDNRSYHIRPVNYHVVERGARRTSLDYGLYQEAHPGFVQKYFEMLKAGGSMHHSELLAPFGLDASSPEFWHKGLNVIAGMIDELEAMD